MRRFTLFLFACMTALFATGCACSQNEKAVVVYFSATGTTEKAAKALAEENKADLYRIEPMVEYTAEDLDWTDKQSRSSVEMQDENSRPELKEGKSLESYDVIYIGYPIWWGVAPRIINTFIEQAQINGKKVIPFATSGGSPVGYSVDALEKSYPEINWQEGRLLND